MSDEKTALAMMRARDVAGQAAAERRLLVEAGVNDPALIASLDKTYDDAALLYQALLRTPEHEDEALEVEMPLIAAMEYLDPAQFGRRVRARRRMKALRRSRGASSAQKPASPPKSVPDSQVPEHFRVTVSSADVITAPEPTGRRLDRPRSLYGKVAGT